MRPCRSVVEHLTKRYGDAAVVNGVSLEIATGELFVLLGPSGSGKSTLLRMIAGLSEVDAGKVWLHGRDVTALSPKDRGIGFVFQHYALFRHMTVADNVEFSLRVARVPKEERRRRREELLELVGLSGFGGRRPQQLSGGQRQRVAIARALANRAPVLLLDEPFGALDAKIRVELRQTIRRVQRDLGVTTVFVTHDQEEAFELGDRIAVLHLGRLLEVGEPEELYLRPQTPFVATFLGAANLLVGQSTPRGLALGPVEIPLRTEAAADDGRRRVEVLFRPEDVEVAATKEALTSLAARLGHRARDHLPGLVRAPAPPAPATARRARRGAGDALRRRLPVGRRQPLAARDAPLPARGRAAGLARPAPRPSARAPRPALPGAAGRIARVRRRREARRGAGAIDSRASVDRRRRGASAASSVPGWPRSAGQAAPDAGPHPGASGLIVRFADGPGASSRDSYDVVMVPAGARVKDTARLLQGGEHHLMVVPPGAALPTRFLICVAVGEPGKEDVLFASRLLRQLGAQATVLTVLPERGDDERCRSTWRASWSAARPFSRARARRPRRRVRRGPPLREIRAELEEGNHDLLVVGAPFPAIGGRSSLGGLVADLLEDGHRVRC